MGILAMPSDRDLIAVCSHFRESRPVIVMASAWRSIGINTRAIAMARSGRAMTMTGRR
jgi:hypothetical protein